MQHVVGEAIVEVLVGLSDDLRLGEVALLKITIGTYGTIRQVGKVPSSHVSTH